METIDDEITAGTLDFMEHGENADRISNCCVIQPLAGLPISTRFFNMLQKQKGA